MNHPRKLTFVLLIFCIALTSWVLHAQVASMFPYLNAGLSPEERAADLVHHMTLEEKASRMISRLDGYGLASNERIFRPSEQIPAASGLWIAMRLGSLHPDSFR